MSEPFQIIENSVKTGLTNEINLLGHRQFQGNNLSCPSEGEGINKLWYSHTIEYYKAEKMNELKPYIGHRQFS